MKTIDELISELAYKVGQEPSSREMALCFTKLQESLFWYKEAQKKLAEKARQSGAMIK